jgi:hypothetical protein
MSEGWWLARPLGRLMMTYMCQALVLWDCKMAKEMRSMLNTLLFNYITPEKIVLDAPTGAVVETPHTLLATSHFMSEQENSFQELEVMKDYDLTII